MADDLHLRKLKEGVTAWNKWRPSDPRFQADLTGVDLTGADLTGVDLKGANLSGGSLTDANLSGARLSGATLKGADLTGADLTGAKLPGANLVRANLSHADIKGADLTDANLSYAVLSGANLTAASLGNAVFTGAKVNSETQGLDGLSDDQRDGLVHVDSDPDAGTQTDAGGRGHQVLPALRGGGGESVADESNWAMHELPPGKSVGVGRGTPGAFARSDAPSRVTQITVGTAQHIIGPAHEVLIGLSIPNDLSEAHRELLREFRRTVEDLKRDLAGVTDQNKLMSGEIEALKNVQKALPVWRETWTTFIAAGAGVAAGTVGASAASYAAGYTAGFIAGVLHDTFSPDSLCIMT